MRNVYGMVYLQKKIVTWKQFFVLFPYRKTLKSFLILSPLLGLTWVFGLLAVTDAGLVFQYVFTILNSTQVCTNYVYACLFGQMGLGLSIRGLCPGKTILIPHFIYRFGSRSLLLRKQSVYFIGLKIKFIQGIIVQWRNFVKRKISFYFCRVCSYFSCTCWETVKFVQLSVTKCWNGDSTHFTGALPVVVRQRCMHSTVASGSGK